MDMLADEFVKWEKLTAQERGWQLDDFQGGR